MNIVKCDVNKERQVFIPIPVTENKLNFIISFSILIPNVSIDFSL